jgi:hypothetical protein
MEISISRKYDMFGFDKKNNRIISKSNVKSKKASIIKFGIANPIIVDENLNIIDGQHRFIALMELGRAIPYVVNRILKPEDVPMLNGSGFSWKPIDYIHSYSNQNDNFKLLEDAVSRYKKLGVSTVSVIFNRLNHNRIDTMAAIRLGMYEYIDNSEIANYLMDLKEDHLSMPTNTAIAIKQIIDEFKYFDKNRLSKFIKQGVRIPNHNDPRQTRKYISDFYNFRIRNEDKIY